MKNIGVECGGTFTDMVVCDVAGNLLKATKVLSTPENPAIAIRALFEALPSDWLEGSNLYHGSTVATNALIERKGPRVALISSRGFKDIIFIQRQDRDRMFDLKYQRPEPLVKEQDSFEIPERIDARGRVVYPLDPASVESVGREIISRGVKDVAVSLIHSYANDLHEQEVKRILLSVDPSLRISLSSEVAPEFREYERVSTTVASAFLLNKVAGYLKEVEKLAEEKNISKVEIMQSNGGRVPLSLAISNPLGMLRSGPAAGVSGAIAAAKTAGITNFVTLDMGGTSTDVALVNELSVTDTTEMMESGIPVRIPMVDIVAVGAGGGSIARVDSGGLLTVGPQSAGADPGPAAYGKGGTHPTVTDANVVIGILRGKSSLSGDLKLDVAASASSFRKLSDQLGLSVTAVAEQVTRLASSSMAGAIRVATVEKGSSTLGHSLVVYGGAGPMHAAEVADELNLRQVIVPPFNGLTSAFGLLASNFRRYFSRTSIHLVSSEQWSQILLELQNLLRVAQNTLKEEGIKVDNLAFNCSMDMRYRGQGYELNVTAPSEQESMDLWIKKFHDIHRSKYGYSNSDADVQVVTLRVRVDGESVTQDSLIIDIKGDSMTEVAEILEHGRKVSCQFIKRSALPKKFEAVGPIVIEDDTSTVYVPTGWCVKVDQNFNLILRK